MIDTSKPTHWCLGFSLDLELGFDDEKYLPRRAAVILYPEYFDKNGEPKLNMLPIDTMEMAEERRKRRKKAEREKKWWYRFIRRVIWKTEKP